MRVFSGDKMFDPIPVLHNKSHIPKIMFLTALARPQPNRNFDGRVGIWRSQYMVEIEDADGVFDEMRCRGCEVTPLYCNKTPTSHWS